MIVADDSAVIREGVVRILGAEGIEGRKTGESDGQ